MPNRGKREWGERRREKERGRRETQRQGERGENEGGVREESTGQHVERKKMKFYNRILGNVFLWDKKRKKK